MHAAKLFDPLVGGEDVEVVEAALPELRRRRRFERLGGALLEELEEGGDGSLLRLVGEEMDVLGHEDVGDEEEALLGSGFLEDALDCVPGFRSGEEGLAAVADEGDEVELAGVVIAL